MKPETRLMAAIFGEKSTGLDDEDYHESVGGLSLREVFESLLEGIAERRSHNAPQFAKRVKELIPARFGFNGPPKTYRELGKMFGVTRERTRQNELQALRMLSHPSRSSQLKPFLK